MKKGISLFLSLLLSGGLYAQSAIEDAPPPQQSVWQTAIMIIIALAFFYLILWKPEQRRKKALEAQRNALKKGDRVTAVGIVGVVSRLLDQTVILKMYDGSKIEVLKAAITDILPDVEEDKKKEDAVEKEAEK